jgi:hypothetical protein
MGMFKFNKVPRHQKFDYIPRYYDPRKEELDDIVNSYKNTKDTDQTKRRIVSGLRSKQRGDSAYKRKHERSANIRLISIIFLLFVVTYLILRSDTILNMMESFLGTE